jgi:TonB family protein
MQHRAACEYPPTQDPRHPLKIGADYYPDASKRANEEGRCVVEVIVTADGRILGETIQTSTGFDRLDEACLKAVHGQRMIPATEDGIPVERTVGLQLAWKLDTPQPQQVDEAASITHNREERMKREDEACKARDQQREEGRRIEAAYAAAKAAVNQCVASHDFVLYEVQHRLAGDLESIATARARLAHEKKVAEGVTSRKGVFSTLRFRYSRFLLAKRPEAALGDTFVGVPVIIAGQMDMFPG